MNFSVQFVKLIIFYLYRYDYANPNSASYGYANMNLNYGYPGYPPLNQQGNFEWTVIEKDILIKQ